MERMKVIRWSSGRRLLYGIVLIMIVALFVTSCASGKATNEAADQAAYPTSAPSASSNMSVTFSESMANAPVPQPEEAGGLGDNYKYKSETTSANSPEVQRKMIMDGSVSLETFDFEKSISLLDQLITSVGGFSESRTVRGKRTDSYGLRSANYVIRVPAERFEAVLKEMGTIGTVLESNSQGTDITDQYYDSETRIKTLKVQEQTLLDILAKATKLEDVITLESRISEVRYEIEKLENTLKNYDRLVALSRITIYISEVDDKTETKPVLKTLNERVAGSFSQSLEDLKTGFEDFLVWLAGSWITLIFLTLIGLILYHIIKRKRKKLMAKKFEVPEIKTEKKE